MLQQLMNHSKWIFGPIGTINTRNRKWYVGYLQFSASHHVCDQWNKTMSTQAKEDPCLVEHSPCLCCWGLIHVPPVSFSLTWKQLVIHHHPLSLLLCPMRFYCVLISLVYLKSGQEVIPISVAEIQSLPWPTSWMFPTLIETNLPT